VSGFRKDANAPLFFVHINTDVQLQIVELCRYFRNPFYVNLTSRIITWEL
jgi:hypothetical protein